MRNSPSSNPSISPDAYSLLSREELINQLKALQAKKTELSENESKWPDYSKSSELTKGQIANRDFLLSVQALIELNLQNSAFGNRDLAKSLGMSESQLYRKIKRLTNRSVAIYIRSLRLHCAKDLLLNTQLTIAEVAYATGFNSPSYFTHVFAKEFAVVPSEIRSQSTD